MKRTLIAGLFVIAACACVLFLLSAPDPLSADKVPAHTVDPSNGETMFWAGGCASCHAAADAKDDARLLLSGGVELGTPFGTFRSPNISPDSQFGIGAWTVLDFVNAMVRGVSPDGAHYYPAFPYPHYQNMSIADVIDLKAFLDTLPASTNHVAAHDLQFPYSVRRGVGLWKRRYLGRTLIGTSHKLPDELARGRYLVEGPGHCGVCHSPRDSFGGAIPDRALAGADTFELPDAAGEDSAGRVPNITPHDDGIGAWSASDIAYSLESGFDPDFDSFGGSMVHVQENMAKLPPSDRAAIAAFLKSIPALPSD